MVFLGSQNSKCQVQAKFQWGEGGYSWVVKTQSAKSWPNFNFFWRESQNLEVPSPGQISMGGGNWVVKTKLKVPSYGQIEIGGGVFLGSQNSKVPSSGQLFIGGGGGILLKSRVFLGKWSKNSGSLACSCIADSKFNSGLL